MILSIFILKEGKLLRKGNFLELTWIYKYVGTIIHFRQHEHSKR